MKLSSLEQKLLSLLSLNGEASLPELARLARSKAHACRYALNNLYDQKLLTRRVIVNAFLLGYSIHALWFALTRHARNKTTALCAFLESSKVVGYFGEFAGTETPYRIDLYTRSAEELGAFFSDISERFGDVFARKEISVIQSITDYPLKYLYPERVDSRSSSVACASGSIMLDDVDRQIVRALATINTDLHARIARTLKLPVATFEYRVRRLRERKVIVGYHVWPNVEKLQELGFYSTVHRIKLRDNSRAGLRTIEVFAQQEPTIFSYTRYIGQNDVELCSSTNSAELGERFCINLERALGDYCDTITSIPMRRHRKVTNHPG